MTNRFDAVRLQPILIRVALISAGLAAVALLVFGRATSQQSQLGEHLAEHHRVDLVWRDTRALEGTADRDRAEIDGGQRGEGPEQLADGGAGSIEDDGGGHVAASALALRAARMASTAWLWGVSPVSTIRSASA